MTTYSDYESLLQSYNFIGGAAQNTLPAILGDSRTVVSSVSGKYQFYYMMLTSTADFSNLNYYSSTDSEDDYMPAGGPALSLGQQYAVQNILHRLIG